MIEEVIYLVTYLITELSNYILAYLVIFQVKISKDIRRWIVAFSLIGIVHGITLVYGGLYNAMPMSMFTMIIIPIFLLEKREKKVFLLYPIVLIGTSIFVISCSYVFSIIANIPEYIFTEGKWTGLVCQMVPTFIMLVIYFERKRKKDNPIQVELGVQQYILFYVVIAYSYIMIGCMQMVSGGKLTMQQSNICGLAISIVCIVMVIFSIWQGIVVYRERRYREQNEIYEEYMKMQEEHFREIQQQDESIRRFRHDMNVHITALKALCNNETNGELEAYLNDMVENSAVYQMKEYTGNKTLDAVIRQLVEEAESKEIKISVNTCSVQLVHISVYDFCTIIYNLIKNAIEACEKIENVNERIIEVHLSSYNYQVFLQIKNRIDHMVVIENNSLITSKSDTKNHGLGSGNVEKAVKKYSGSLEYSCERGWFLVEVYV